MLSILHLRTINTQAIVGNIFSGLPFPILDMQTMWTPSYVATPLILLLTSSPPWFKHRLTYQNPMAHLKIPSHPPFY
jgi:hypothetical protein